VNKIAVKLKDNPYMIYINSGLSKEMPELIKEMKLGSYGIVITSKSIADIYKKNIKTWFNKSQYHLVVIPDGEKAKSKKWLFTVINELIKKDSWNKKLFIVCLGGGVVGDLGGFIASIYKRGIPYIQIPTTLLSQIDSSIGGKTAIDTKEAKNILGSFYQPKAVLIDPDFLKTLPEQEIKQGMAEAIKYGVIKDKKLFYLLKNNKNKIMTLDKKLLIAIITRCASIKADIVTKDEKEKRGLRTILNFGHTLAHSIESAAQYKQTPHGYAVSIGMVYAAYLANYLNICSRNTQKELEAILKLYKMPVSTPIAPLSLYKSFIYDKKFISGKIRMVLPQTIGKVKVLDGINPDKIKKTLMLFGCRSI
jgi:3-dehydroquinate synthase